PSTQDNNALTKSRCIPRSLGRKTYESESAGIMSNRPVRCKGGKRRSKFPCLLRGTIPSDQTYWPKRLNAMTASLAAVLVGLLGFAGCNTLHPALGPAHNEFQVVERDNSEILHVKLRMGAGDLRVGSGTEKLARADFLYNVDSWKPEVHYSN